MRSNARPGEARSAYKIIKLKYTVKSKLKYTISVVSDWYTYSMISALSALLLTVYVTYKPGALLVTCGREHAHKHSCDTARAVAVCVSY